MDIADRIRKLITLSERNSNTHEAAAAAAKAQQLCFDYNLELENILKSGVSQRAPYVKADYVMQSTRNDNPWKRGLFGHIAKFNFCKAIYYPGTSRMGVVGQKHNFDVVCYMFEYLVAEIERLAKQSLRDEGITEKKSGYIRRFCEGAKTSIYWRLVESQKQSQQATSETNALVIVKDAELGIASFKFFGQTHTTHRRILHTNGFQQGRTAGNSIPLNQGMGNVDRKKLN